MEGKLEAMQRKLDEKTRKLSEMREKFIAEKNANERNDKILNSDIMKVRILLFFQPAAH